MLAKLGSYTLVGIDATPVEVEFDVSFTANPKTILVGLAEAAVRASTHRVERAIVNSGYRRPIDRVVINPVCDNLLKIRNDTNFPLGATPIFPWRQGASGRIRILHDRSFR